MNELFGDAADADAFGGIVYYPQDVLDRMRYLDSQVELLNAEIARQVSHSDEEVATVRRYVVKTRETLKDAESQLAEARTALEGATDKPAAEARVALAASNVQVARGNAEMFQTIAETTTPKQNEKAVKDEPFLAAWRAWRDTWKTFFRDHQGWLDRTNDTVAAQTVAYEGQFQEWRKRLLGLGCTTRTMIPGTADTADPGEIKATLKSGAETLALVGILFGVGYLIHSLRAR